MSNENFIRATRRRYQTLATMQKGSINPVSWEIPKAGFLASIYLYITATVAGTISAPNALGAACIIRRVRLQANGGINLIDISGADYHYLLRDYIDSYQDPVPHSTARNAVSATTFILDMLLPVALNLRDPVGLFPLQQEATTLILSIEFEADANVCTGSTSITCSVTPVLEVFSVPTAKEALPDIVLIQQIVSDQRTVSGAGDQEYRWPRGSNYLGVYHGAGIGATPADNWSRLIMRANKSETLLDLVPATLNLDYTRTHGIARRLGHVAIDLMGSSGLGFYGSSRDIINSAALTELDTTITFTAASTLYTVRRMLVPIVG